MLYLMDTVEINIRSFVDSQHKNDGERQRDLNSREERKQEKRDLLSSHPLRSYSFSCYLSILKLSFLAFPSTQNALCSHHETEFYLCEKSWLSSNYMYSEVIKIIITDEKLGEIDNLSNTQMLKDKQEPKSSVTDG